MTMKRMFKEMLTTSRYMKVISIITVASMLLTLTACGGTASQQDAVVTTESNSKMPQQPGAPEEPNQDIDDGADISEPTEDPNPSTGEPSSTEESPSDNDTTENPPTGGAYTYTVYGDIQLSMDVNIDDWTGVNSEGQSFFKYDKLAQSLGWRPENQDLASFGNGGAHFYAYPTGNMTVTFTIYGNETRGNVAGYSCPQLYGIDYFFGTNDNLEVSFYDDPENLDDEDKYAIVEFQDHSSEVEYLIVGARPLMASRDDIIVIAYMLSNVTVNPEKNPIVNTELASRYSRGGGTFFEYLLP